MKPYDLIDALGELDDETVLSARAVQTPISVISSAARNPSLSMKKRNGFLGRRLPRNDRSGPVPMRRRIPGAALIAAILVIALSIGAVAYAISHANTARLMAAGPHTGGREAVAIDETGQQLIDNASVDYGIRCTDHGTTVTLDSVMGFADQTKSLVYLTLTITPPEGFEFPDDMTDWGFWGSSHLDTGVTGGGSSVAVKNDDGTASFMLMWITNEDVRTLDARLRLGGGENGGFGISSKENAPALFDGSRQIELPGSWEFDLGRIELAPTQELALDRQTLAEAGLPLKSLHLTSFGGIALMDNPHVHDAQIDRLRAAYPEELEALLPGADWAAMTEADLEELMTSEDTPEDVRVRLLDLLAWLPPVDYGGVKTLTVEYPDGSSYTAEDPGVVWEDFEQNGDLSFTILFLNPQPISQASAIVINDVQVWRSAE